LALLASTTDDEGMATMTTTRLFRLVHLQTFPDQKDSHRKDSGRPLYSLDPCRTE
jgi:hypothetical protein